MDRLSRRQLLRRAAAVGFATPLAPFALNLSAVGRAAAATATDYRALVCIFLYGGNDGYNTVLATDAPSWSAYNVERGSGTSPLALCAPGTAVQAGSANFNAQLGGALPISPVRSQNRSFALHPSLAPLRDLFNAGRVGIIANVGALVRPTTKTAYLNGTASKPANLFSHNDQQSTWQTYGIEGTTLGWGGRLSDNFLAGNAQPAFSCVSLYSNAAWLQGQQARMYQLSTSGSVHIGGTDGTVFGSAVAEQQLQQIASTGRTPNMIEQDHAAVVGRSIAADAVLASALPLATAGPWGTSGLAAGAVDPLLQYRNPNTGVIEVNPLALQLQTIARTIAARNNLGMTRQVFYAGLDGCDTHDSQPRNHAVAMARLAHAMAYFDSTLSAMGVNQNVTTFTTSEFGRTFASNGDGTDHGWGSHHFVMGGAVKGGDIYGTFPTYGTSDGQGGFTSPDQVGGGVLLPTTSIDQYAATLGKWFGADDATLLTIMPNLINFGTSVRDLGFMNA
jgi:uncharacterized protein (DUF1501 family)